MIAASAINHTPDIQLLKPFPRHGNANETPAISSHEIDGTIRHFVGSHDEIPFVLPILVIRNNHHFATVDIRYNGLYRIKYLILFTHEQSPSDASDKTTHQTKKKPETTKVSGTNNGTTNASSVFSHPD
jgi:hypothetical protein